MTATMGNGADRRKRTDIWARLLTGFNAASWVIILAILIVTERAKPEFESFFDRFYRLDIRTTWDMAYVEYLLYLAVGGAGFSVVGLLLSMVRARRRTDRKRLSLLIAGIVSVVGIVCVLIFQ